MKLHIEDTIAKSAKEVFDAIINPEKLVNHFVDSTSGPIVEEKTTHWSFGEFGEVDVRVTRVVENEIIEFSWQATGLTTEIQIKLEQVGHSLTKIMITEGDWRLDKDSFAIGLGQTQGWTAFIDGLKAYLLFNINLREGKKLS